MNPDGDISHTPGPWTLEESTGEIVDALGLRIARVPVGTTEERANARLIAASPMLYQALLELSGQVDWAFLGDTPALLAALKRAALARDLAERPDPGDDGEPY